MNAPRILVLGAGGPAAINWIRAIKREWPAAYVFGVDSNAYHLHLAPLDCSCQVPRFDDSSLGAYVAHIIDSEDIDVVYAAPDAGVQWLMEGGAEIARKCNAAVILPSITAWAISRDKWLTASVLGAHRVPVPVLARWKEPHLFFKRFAKGWMRLRTGAGSRGAMPVNSLEDAEAWARIFPGKTENDSWMISEYLPGPEFAWQALYDRGELVAAVGRQRLEYLFGEQMPSGQSSSPSVARIVDNPELTALGQWAVHAIDETPHGIYGVDAKTDSGGVLRVTEVNVGRFYTTSDFCAAAGMNLPAMFVRMALGEKPNSEAHKQIVGLTWVRSADCEPVLLAA